MIFVVGRKVNMLSKIKGGEKRKKLRGEVITRIIKMYVKVASNDEFVRCGSSEREEIRFSASDSFYDFGAI